jgi:hypothetical protein
VPFARRASRAIFKIAPRTADTTANTFSTSGFGLITAVMLLDRCFGSPGEPDASRYPQSNENV